MVFTSKTSSSQSFNGIFGRMFRFSCASYFGSTSGGSCSIEGKAKHFLSVSHFGVLSADVQRSNSIPESGDTPI